MLPRTILSVTLDLLLTFYRSDRPGVLFRARSMLRIPPSAAASPFSAPSVAVDDGRRSKAGPFQTLNVSGRSVRTIFRLPCAARARSSQSFTSFSIWNRIILYIEKRSEEHTSELQSLMRISYAVFCLKKNKPIIQTSYYIQLIPQT